MSDLKSLQTIKPTKGLSGNLSLVERSGNKKTGYRCTAPLCGEVFKIKKLFEDHMKAHNGEKPFQCLFESCGKSFSQFSSLQKHEKIHRGEKPYKCDRCERNFTQMSNLKRHEQVHSGEKPHICEICDKSFTTISNLKQHQQVHAGEQERQRFVCERCGKGYLYHNSLNKHIRSHARKDAKAAIKAAKLAAKKGKGSKGLKATKNAEKATKGLLEQQNTAPDTKNIVKEEVGTHLSLTNLPTNSANYNIDPFSIFGKQLDPFSILGKQSDPESSTEYILNFASFESNLAEATLRKKRFSSFLEFVDGINVNQEETFNAKKPDQQNDDPLKDFGEKRARNKSILSFLENDFFGESVSTKENVKEPSFLESLDNSLKIFGDSVDPERARAFENKIQDNSRLIKSRMDSGFFLEIDPQAQSRRNSSFLFF